MAWEEEEDECDICPDCLNSRVVEVMGDLGRGEWDVIGLKACDKCKDNDKD